MQPVKRMGLSALYLLTAVVTGYWALRLMLLPINAGPQSSWPAIMLGASILLLVAGVYAVVPRIRGIRLVLLASAIPLVLCLAVFHVLIARCWFFAIVLALTTWVVQTVASALNRPGLLLTLVSLILAASWVPFSVNTLRLYLVQTTYNAAPVGLFLSLAPWVLIFVSVGAGILVWKLPISDGTGTSGV